MKTIQDDERLKRSAYTQEEMIEEAKAYMHQTTQAAVSSTVGRHVRRCIGYGPHEGKCENEAGTPWGPHWCLRCDKIRLATISQQLTDIVNSFPSNSDLKGAEK